MTAELLICVMPGEGCRFQHGKHLSNYFSGGYWPKMYSTGQRRKSICSQAKCLNIKQWKKSLTESFQVAAMCFAKHTPIWAVCAHQPPFPQCANSSHLQRAKDTVEVVYLALCWLQLHIQSRLLSWSAFKSAAWCGCSWRGCSTRLMCFSTGTPAQWNSLCLDSAHSSF